MSRSAWLLLVTAVAAGCAHATGGSGGQTDAGTSIDGALIADGAPPDAPPGTGFWGECSQSSDCDSAICLPNSDAIGSVDGGPPDGGSSLGHCTQTCTKVCPKNFECQTVQFGGINEIDVCVPAKQTFCNPCQINRDCGDSSDLCISLTDGKFCSINCKNNPTICPAGFTCQMLGDVGDVTDAWQCMPIDGICCIDADGNRHGVGGGCLGADCDDHNPKVYNGASEVCDTFDNDCNGSVNDNPVNCKKPFCDLGPFGYVGHPGEPCTGGHCVAQTTVNCGLYTCSGGGSIGDSCATACDGEDDSKCIPPAHCDNSVCLRDLPNGGACDENSDCTSDHCQNHFCCDSGDCCNTENDCPTFGTFSAICEDPATCQGTRGAATCTNNRCGTANGVADDSGCTATTVANTCGFYKSIYCAGGTSQTAPTCPTSCTSNNDCDPEGYCEPITHTCVGDLDDGGACATDDARCKSGHCQNHFCCASGDCCAGENDCPASYSTPPVCTAPSACQGSRNVAQCVRSICSTQMNVDDDSACSASLVANDCGPYLPLSCNGSAVQSAPVCPTSCASSLQCDSNAYCNPGGACVPDEPNGRACRADGDCQSAHCQNGFCCGSGDCCSVASDCGTYARSPVCNFQSSCQGTRVDPVCSASFQCGPQTVDDDSACAGLQSNDCGPYPAISCTNAQTQNPAQATLCPASCVDDNGCDPSAHCSPSGMCVGDQGPGGFCNQQNECMSGLSCVDHVCCTSSCTGLCQRCDVAGHVGTCWSTPNGQDLDSECGDVSCSAFYKGFVGSTCYHKADVSAAAASCNGSGMCNTTTTECTNQQTQGAPAITCNSTCQAPTGGTCTGMSPGTCTNLDNTAGTNTCGLGACRVTQNKCVNGAPHTCSPPSGTTEICDGIDNDCNGVVDDGTFGDGYEPDDSCGVVRTLPQIGSGQTQNANFSPALGRYPYGGLTIYPVNDVDYYYVHAVETDSSCACCDFWCTDEKYRFSVTLGVPSGAGTYEVCYGTSCGANDRCFTVNGGNTSNGSTYLLLDGGCDPFSSDSYNLYIRVFGLSGASSCAPYTLSYGFQSGVCN